MTSPLPLALYIHIPWCEKKCPYCDFNSHQARGQLDEDGYVAALLADLDADLAYFSAECKGRKLSSIFIGGGTPSLFSSDSFTRLLDGVGERIEFADGIEITSEANPGSSEAEKFAGFRAAGVNRLSIGVQSFAPHHLSALGRVHSAGEAVNAAAAARRAGFDNFNLDLMFGLPKQSLGEAIEDLQQAIDLHPSHLSCYQLTIEPNTLFHHSPPITPDHETLWEMQLALQNALTDAGYRQYEVSAYAQQSRQCLHNKNYWQFGDYLGIGAGAHGKITGSDGEVSRSWKIKHPNAYLQKESRVGGIEAVAADQLPFEFMLNNLRLTEGFAFSMFEQRTHQTIDSILNILARHQDLDLITLDGDHARPTARGRQMLDSMLQDYLP